MENQHTDMIDSAADAIKLFETRPHMADQLTLSIKSIGLAATQGIFPASWYLIIRNEAERQGKQISEQLFRFRLPPPPPPGEIVERGDIVADAGGAVSEIKPEKLSPSQDADNRETNDA